MPATSPCKDPDAAPAVRLEAVSKSFGDHRAVNRLSLTVPRGCIYGFIGPNGAGKTTTLRMIMNIIRPDSGEIRILGRALESAGTDPIGYMPEERGLYKKMKVLETLEFYGALKCGRNVRALALDWLERLNLRDWAHRKVETLSKGMSQKIQFIATVLTRPDLIILDEPFSGLDPVNATNIREAIIDLRNQGTTVILSTHDMQVAEDMCDFIFMIFQGNKVLDGTLDSIQQEYGHDTLRVRSEAGRQVLEQLDGVISVSDYGQVQELHINGNRDPQAIMRDLMNQARVTQFELAKPSLHDIFVRIAGVEAKEALHD